MPAATVTHIVINATARMKCSRRNPVTYPDVSVSASFTLSLSIYFMNGNMNGNMNIFTTTAKNDIMTSDFHNSMVFSPILFSRYMYATHRTAVDTAHTIMMVSVIFRVRTAVRKSK